MEYAKKRILGSRFLASDFWWIFRCDHLAHPQKRRRKVVQRNPKKRSKEKLSKFRTMENLQVFFQTKETRFFQKLLKSMSMDPRPETAFKNTVTLDAITQIIDAFFGMHTPHTINCKTFSGVFSVLILKSCIGMLLQTTSDGDEIG